ncbi:hypothetical protein ACPPVV_10680 [Rhodanobacter sp. Col0626]|uniref:hypothetical protein n=1 Tax=Rhodanobacter sp. Col0626 TaxID=3415679 RepID=UPI003CF30706
MRCLITAIVLLATASCTTLYPVVPRTTESELEQKGALLQSSITTPEEARNLVFGKEDELSRAAYDKQVANIVFQEVTFYGTFMAVAGVVANSIAARNTGAGLAALSSALSGHYQPGDQRLAFQKAETAMLCIKDAISPIDPAIREAFDENFDLSGDDAKDLATAYYNVPVVTVHAIRTIGTNLLVALNSFTLPTPSASDITALGKSLEAAKTRSEDIVGKTSSENSQKNIQTAIDSLTANVASNPQISLTMANILRVGGVAPSTEENCQAKELPGELRRACTLSKLKAMTPNELADAKRRFVEAAVQYDTTVSACLATKQQ